jgi:hypothetical protein
MKFCHSQVNGCNWKTSSFFFLFSFYFSFLHLLTCVYIVCGTPTTPSPTPRQNLFHPLLLPFCWQENISDNKKDILCLLVWDKDSYTERFLALFPCTCVLQPTLVHFYQTSSLLPGPLPTVASASFRLLYSLLNSEQINYIQVLGFLLKDIISSEVSQIQKAKGCMVSLICGT